MRPVKPLLSLCVLLSPLLVAGCRSGKPKAAPEKHPIQGKVVAVNAADSTITLDHQAIPGFMEAMTMDYKVDDPAALGELHAGDRISATLLNDRDAAGPSHLRLHEIVVTAQAKPDYKPAVVYHVPSVGDVVPDFALLNQSGKTIHVHDYRGKAVAITFIYTRCPLADYCPRMSHNFAEIEAAAAKDAKLANRLHLLSVSFDPAYDTPSVLKSYGEGVTGRFTKERFADWDFAAPQGKELLEMEKWFGVGVTPGENGTLAHSLSTTIVGADGKVVAFYPSNDWTVDQAMGDLRKALPPA